MDDSIIRELKADIKAFGRRVVSKYSKTCDLSGEWPEKLYKEAAGLGYTSMDIPEEFGGLALEGTEIVPLIEEMAYADAGFAVTIAANALALRLVLNFGTETQKRHICSSVLDGGYGAFCLTEQQAGTGILGCITRAQKLSDGYVINGKKCFVTNGGYADFYCVFAKLYDGEKSLGFSWFIVDGEKKGVTVLGHEDKMGIRLSNTSEISFDDCFVSEDSLIGSAGNGIKMALAALDYGRILMGSAASGLASRCLDEAVQYSLTRVQSGKAIAENQVIKMKIAEMAIRLETARTVTMSAMKAWCLNEPASKAASIAKCVSSDAAVENALEAIQIFGGYGYSRSYSVEKLLRDAKVFQIFEGTNEIQRLAIADELFSEFGHRKG